MTEPHVDDRTGKSARGIRFVRNPDVAQREIDDTVFLVNPVEDTIFYLNAISAGIWHLIAEPTSCAEAERIVQEAFPNTLPDKIASDVSQLFRELEEKKLIKRHD